MKKRLILLLLLLLSIWLAAEEKTSLAFSIMEKPKLDGRLTEAFYSKAEPAGDFIQFHPENGAAAVFSTRVYILFTSHALYIAFQCDDPEPAKIKADVTPFGAFHNNDEVEVLLDPFADQRNYVSFIVNPRGIRAGLDTIWSAAAEINEKGWSAEIEIPFKSLRFPAANGGEWRINFRRRIFRLNETDYWTEVPREKEAVLASTFGLLEGLQSIRGGRNIEIFPYAGWRDSRSGDFKESRFAYGLDLKYGITSNLTLDLTTSPDYSDVESDPFFYQTNPYEYHLSDNRPFYTEGSQYFSTAFNLFYSRRITNPNLALKLTGKEKGTSMGLLLANNDRESGDQFFGVLRVKKDVFKLSEIGLIYSSMESKEGWNRNIGLDFKFNIAGGKYVCSGMAAFTFNKNGENRNNGLYRVIFGKRLQEGFSYAMVLDRFEPNVSAPAGFINMVDFQKYWLLPRYLFLWEGKFLERLQLTSSLVMFRSISRSEMTSIGMEPIVTASFRNQLEITASWLLANDRPQLLDTEGNLYWHERLLPYRGPTFYVDYNGHQVVQGGISLMFLRGGVYSDDYQQVKKGANNDFSAWINLKLSPRWQWQASWTHSDYRSDDKSFGFRGQILSTDMRYQFSRTLSSFAKFQYDSLDKRFGYDLLFLYEPAPVSRMVLSLKNYSEERFRIFHPAARTLALKFSYLFRI